MNPGVAGRCKAGPGRRGSITHGALPIPVFWGWATDPVERAALSAACGITASIPALWDRAPYHKDPARLSRAPCRDAFAPAYLNSLFAAFR